MLKPSWPLGCHELHYYTKRARKKQTTRKIRTSYTTLPGPLLLTSPISAPVASCGLHPLLPVGLIRGHRNPSPPSSRLKVSFQVARSAEHSAHALTIFTSSISGFWLGLRALPRRPLVKFTSPPFKAWTLSKTQKLVSAFNVAKAHQEIRSIITARMMPAGSFAHNSLLNKIASRPTATVNAIMLSIDEVKPADHTTKTDLSRLTPRAVTNEADCTRLRGFQTQRHCDDELGDNNPITGKTSIAVSLRKGQG